jgi:hypothetical protein
MARFDNVDGATLALGTLGAAVLAGWIAGGAATVTVRDARGAYNRNDRAGGRAWFNSLSNAMKWEIGDALVLGYFDWRDYDELGLTTKPSGAFLSGVDDARIQWEMTR